MSKEETLFYIGEALYTALKHLSETAPKVSASEYKMHDAKINKFVDIPKGLTGIRRIMEDYQSAARKNGRNSFSVFVYYKDGRTISGVHDTKRSDAK